MLYNLLLTLVFFVVKKINNNIINICIIFFKNILHLKLKHRNYEYIHISIWNVFDDKNIKNIKQIILSKLFNMLLFLFQY